MATRDAYLGGGQGGAGQMDTANPFGGTGGMPGVTGPPQPAAMVPYNQPTVGFAVTLPNGQKIMVGGEADYLKLKEWHGLQNTSSEATLGSRIQYTGASRGINWLNTGGDVVQGVAGFLQDRNLRRHMEDIRTAMQNASRARADLLIYADKHPDSAALVGLLIASLDAQYDVNVASLAALDDELTAVDLATGGSVAKVLADFGVGSSQGRGFGGLGGLGSGMGSALAAGGIGLGLGLLLSRNSGSASGNTNLPPR